MIKTEKVSEMYYNTRSKATGCGSKILAHWYNPFVVSSVMEVARRLVWRCLVDDPVLFFRTILEQLTKKDKQVSL